MSVGILDPAAMLDYATKNLRVEKLLIQVGLDPSLRSTNLNKEFFDPEIFGRVIEHCSRIDNANTHGGPRHGRISVPDPAADVPEALFASVGNCK